MRIISLLKTLSPVFLYLIFFAADAHAEANNADILDSVLERYLTAAEKWGTTITERASWLFWLLATISLVWTFSMMILKKAEIGEIIAELVRFIMFTGFFWWLLINGPFFANSIIQSMQQIASEAVGLDTPLSPSLIVDIGFEVFWKVLDNADFWSPLDNLVSVLMALSILIILALIAVNMLLLIVSAWILAYGGVFFLGFGGSQWTSDMAINYYKTVLGIGTQLFAMILLIGIGTSFLNDFYAAMSAGISLKDMTVLLIVAIVLLVLVNKIPPLISGIITGASVSGGGIGGFGAGAMVGAAGMAMAAAATGGAAMMGGLVNAAGGAQAVMAA
ncbi:MAG: P-type conjugative transfer protein TrbL, partial [Gammaproteobacteria bacterium]